MKVSETEGGKPAGEPPGTGIIAKSKDDWLLGKKATSSLLKSRNA